MALDTQLWIKEIEEILFPDNSILNFAKDDSMFLSRDVFGTPKTIHIPQSGSNPAVAKNRNSFPAAITQRTDRDFTYDMNQYTTDPLLISDLEQQTLSYDKRKSFLYQHVNTLEMTLCNNALYAWSPSGGTTSQSPVNTRVIRTTGASSSLSLCPSATGTRLALTLADIQAAASQLDKDFIPREGRILAVPSDIYWNDIMGINNIQAFYAYGQATLPNGNVKQIMGFELKVRPSISVYDNAAAPLLRAVSDNGVVTSPASTDNYCVLAYHPDFVSNARAGIEVFIREKEINPEYYSSVFSALVWHGAGKRRDTSVGVCAIVQKG